MKKKTPEWGAGLEAGLALQRDHLLLHKSHWLVILVLVNYSWPKAEHNHSARKRR
jgi:hypothetical protein